MGLSAGALTASPVRKLKHAWCHGQRTVSPTIALAARGPELPPLPAIALETFPPDARTALEAALLEARRKPQDAGAAGALGIALQAPSRIP